MNNSKAQLLTEVIVAAGLLSIFSLAIFQIFVLIEQNASLGKKETQASALLQEGIESTRFLKSSDWDNLSPGRYRIASSAGQLSLVATASAETIGQFSRYILIDNVQRDANGQIVQSGGTIDPSLYKATAFVSWEGFTQQQLSTYTFLAKLKNLVWTQTTEQEFNQAEKEYIKVTNDNGGEFQLSGGCEEDPESNIYDEELVHGWRLCWPSDWFCLIESPSDNGGSIKERTSIHVYDGPYAMRVRFSENQDGYASIWNFDDVCTKGFRTLHFWAYNNSASQKTLLVTGVSLWRLTPSTWNEQVVLEPFVWQEVSIPYQGVMGDHELNLFLLFFGQQSQGAYDVYLDEIELLGGTGGYYNQGHLISTSLNTGRPTTFNRIQFTASTPINTSIGFQIATSLDPNGPWEFIGPNGSTMPDDLYTQSSGQGISLANNYGQYLKYKAYLTSDDGQNTPIVEDISINYAP